MKRLYILSTNPVVLPPALESELREQEYELTPITAQILVNMGAVQRNELAERVHMQLQNYHAILLFVLADDALDPTDGNGFVWRLYWNVRGVDIYGQDNFLIYQLFLASVEVYGQFHLYRNRTFYGWDQAFDLAWQVKEKFEPPT